MSKKQEKHKYSSKTNKRKKRKSAGSRSKKNTKKISLATRLSRVYEDTVSLETTCEGRCECCKVAMPQMNYCEFLQLSKEIWDKESNDAKLDMLCVSMEYFFRNEFDKWEMDSLVKPCMLLSEDDKCRYYQSRPLSCRIYGMWPEKDYETRVDRFVDQLDGKLKRKKIPLNKQCPYVKRMDNSVELTTEVIQGLFDQLDEIDSKISSFSTQQIKKRNNYRTFHDWLLLKTIGETWLTKLSTMTLAANREILEDQIRAVQQVWREEFAEGVPDIQ